MITGLAIAAIAGLTFVFGPSEPRRDYHEYEPPVTPRHDHGTLSELGKWYEPVTFVSAEKALREGSSQVRGFAVDETRVHLYASSPLAQDSTRGYYPEAVACNIRIEYVGGIHPRGPYNPLTRAFRSACATDLTLDVAQVALLIQRVTRPNSGAIEVFDSDRSSGATVDLYTTATAATVIAEHDAAYLYGEHLERAVCNTIIVGGPVGDDKPTTHARKIWEEAVHRIGHACGEDTTRADTLPPEPLAEKYWSEADFDDAAANAADDVTGEPAAICDVASPPGSGRLSELTAHDPPTSGTLAATPAPWGIHEQQPTDARVLRNLQQGGVAIWYSGHDNEWRRELPPLIERHEKVIAAPREGLDEDEMIATGYGLLYRCTQVRNIPNLVQYLEKGFVRATLNAEPLDRLPRKS